jgi:hypothetical protein
VKRKPSVTRRVEGELEQLARELNRNGYGDSDGKVAHG